MHLVVGHIHSGRIFALPVCMVIFCQSFWCLGLVLILHAIACALQMSRELMTDPFFHI